MSIASTTPETVGLSAAAHARTGLVSSYMQLTKARLSAMVLVTTAVGYVVAAPQQTNWLTFLWTIMGTALAAGSAAAFNQVLEVRLDARMLRTQQRPLVSGAMSVRHATIAATVMGAGGVGILLAGANALAASLALLTIVLYVLVYTPMKVRSSLNTLVGAVVGALPPMIGWCAATGALEEGAFVLGAVLFFWQIPHFLALAWMYRDDYARGRFVMLPVIDPHGEITSRVIVLTSLMMIPIALIAVLAGLGGWLYAAAAILLGLMLVLLAARMYMQRSRGSARAVFLASIIYLPMLMGMLVLDRGPVSQPANPATVAMLDVPARTAIK